MNREKLIKHLVKNTTVDRDDVERVLNELEFTILKTIASDESIKMFAGFEIRPHNTKTSYGQKSCNWKC